MRDFNAAAWSVSTGTQELYLEGGIHHVQIEVSCTKPVALYGLCGEKKVPFQSGTSFRYRGKVQGFDLLHLVGTGKTPFGFSFLAIPRQDGEPLNDEDPPAPPLPGSDNLLLQVRRMMQREAARNRPPVMEPDDFRGFYLYDIEDDDLDFEEELLAKAEKAAKETPPAPPADGGKPKSEPPPAAPEKAPEAPPPAAPPLKAAE